MCVGAFDLVCICEDLICIIQVVANNVDIKNIFLSNVTVVGVVSFQRETFLTNLECSVKTSLCKVFFVYHH